jgi:hypothetical protein
VDVSIRFVDSPRVFGALVVPQRAALVARVGEDVFARALASVPREERDEYVATRVDTWCRGSSIEHVVTELARASGIDARDLTDASVAVAIAGNVAKLWRALMVVTSDDALLRRTPMFYARSYDRGSLSGERVAPGRAELVLEGWPNVPELQAVGIAAGVRTVLTLARRPEVRVDWHRDGELARFDVTWRV